MTYLIVISLWALFGLQHSYLARPIFKEKVQKYLGINFEKYCYRFFYFVYQCIVFYCCYDILNVGDTGELFYIGRDNDL